jgi:[acyl-carrier-protein] S-malonyltransferase
MAQVAFLFPGQGAQTVGMGRELVELLPAARELFDRASLVLGYDLGQVCFEGPAEDLDSTAISQPALYVTSLAALEKLKAEQPEAVENCSATAGLSLGEYTALAFAGVFDFESGLRLVAERGAAMQAASDAVPSGMVSILGMDLDKVEELCRRAAQGEVLQVANLLCPGNIVVSGNNAACQRVADLAVAEGAMKVIPLAVAGAFHTPIMQPAVERLTAALANVPMSPPRIPVVSNVDAQPHNDPEEIRQLLVRQLVSPVQWEASQRWLLQSGCDHFYEVGPGRVLRGLLKRIDRKVACDGAMS